MFFQTIFLIHFHLFTNFFQTFSIFFEFFRTHIRASYDEFFLQFLRNLIFSSLTRLPPSASKKSHLAKRRQMFFFCSCWFVPFNKSLTFPSQFFWTTKNDEQTEDLKKWQVQRLVLCRIFVVGITKIRLVFFVLIHFFGSAPQPPPPLKPLAPFDPSVFFLF